MKFKIKSISLFIFLSFSIGTLWSQIPAGYYDTALGKEGQALQLALHNIIKGHTSVSYSSLHTYYQSTDKKPNGKVWDMYSDIPGGTPPYEFTFITDKCGNYANEGDCYNREHSFPQSWFSSASPMKSDLFHVYPTDGKVNGWRSNYPYGEVSNPTRTTLNGSKLGPNTFPGYSGTVFEPIDAYKGDFARTYFYMAVRYYTEDGSWPGSDMVNGSQLKPWALSMLYQWHLQDTVSQKEIDRNNAVYQIQHNRNPFIDRPDWVDSLWFPSHVSIGENPQAFSLNLYPIPAKKYIFIQPHGDFNQVSLKLYDMQGRLLKETQLHSGTKNMRLELHNLQSGVYLLQWQSGNAKGVEKVIIQK